MDSAKSPICLDSLLILPKGRQLLTCKLAEITISNETGTSLLDGNHHKKKEKCFH